MSALTYEQKVFLELVGFVRGDYPDLDAAMDGNGDDTKFEEVREQNMEVMERAAEHLNIETGDDPEVYGPYLDLICDNWPSLGEYIERTSE